MIKNAIEGEPIMKTKEELSALKEEVKTLNKKLAELSEDELKQVTGGAYPSPKVVEDYPFDAYRERVIIRSHEGDHTDIDSRKDLYENIIL